MGLFCLILPSQLGTWYSQICLLWLVFCLPGLLRYLLIMIFSERRGKTPVGKVQACFFTAGFDRKKDVLQKDWEILLQLQTVRLPTTVTNLTRHAETRARLAPVVISDTSCAHYFSFFCANCCSIRVVRPTKISCNHRFCAHRRSGAIGAGGDFAHGLRSRLLANVTQSAAIMRGTVSSRRPFCFAQERPCVIGWRDICAGETEAICG